MRKLLTSLIALGRSSQVPSVRSTAFASLVLEAAYEATLLAAAVRCRQRKGWLCRDRLKGARCVKPLSTHQRDVVEQAWKPLALERVHADEFFRRHRSNQPLEVARTCGSRGVDCKSAWGPDADRRAKLLICRAVKGSTLGRLFASSCRTRLGTLQRPRRPLRRHAQLWSLRQSRRRLQEVRHQRRGNGASRA